MELSIDQGPTRTEDREIAGRPRLARFVLRRAELVRRVEQATAAQVVVLRGPAGAGKTTLLADWADEVSRAGGRRGVWVTAEPGPDARAELWHDVADRLLRSDDPARRVDLGDPDRRLRGIAGLLRDEPVVLVLDDADLVEDPALAQDIRWLLRRCPGLTVVLVSRSRTVFEQSGAASGFDVEHLDVDALTLSPEQAHAALGLRGASFDTAALDRLTRTFRGSPMAVFRVGSHLAMEGRRVWRETDIEPVLERVRAEVAAELTEGLRRGPHWDALRAVAVLPYLTPALASEVLGDEQATAFLAAAERAGLGGWVRSTGRDRFVLSALARRALDADVDEDADTAARFRSTAARALAADGDTAAAMRLAHDGGDWQYFSDVLRSDYARLCTADATEVAARIDAVDAAHRESDPWLLMLRASLAFALEGPRSSRAVSLFDRADAATRDLLKDASGVVALQAVALRTLTLRRSGSHGRATAMARRLVEMLDVPATVAAARSLPGLVGEARVQAGITLLYDGAPVESLQQFGAALRSADAPDHVRVQAHGYLALVRAIRGEVVQARTQLDRLAADPAWTGWRHSTWGVPAQLAAAVIALEVQEPRRVREHLEVVERLRVDVEDWPFVAYVRGLVAVSGGAGHSGFSSIRDIEGRCGAERISNHLQGLLFVVKSDLLLLAKQARPALAALRPFLDGRETVIGAQARALLFSGNSARARLFAERFAWRDRLSPRVQMELAVVKAVASARHEDLDGAVVALERARAVGLEHGLHLPWRLVPHDELRALVERAMPELVPVVDRAQPVFTSGLTVPTLTRRESIVLAHLRGPGAIEDIAHDLMVSPNTVKTQVQSVYRKLGVKARADAVRVAFEWRLIGASSPAESDEAQYSS